MTINSTKPARILLVTTSSLALWVFFRDQARYLRSHGFEVVTTCAPGPYLDEFERYTGCQVIRIGMHRTITPLHDLIALFQLWRVIRKLRPEIVHTHTPKAGLLGMVAARLAGSRIRIHTFHGLRSETLAGLKGAVVHFMERLTGQLATQCLAVSGSLRRALIADRVCASNHIKVLGNGGCAGVDLQAFQPAIGSGSGDLFRKQYGIPENATLVTYAGRIAKEKGIEVLANAWSQISAQNLQAWLLIYGPLDDTDPVSPECLSFFEKNARTTLLFGMNTRVPEMMGATNICVLPSFREGLGVVALEAAAMSVPVVGSAVTGLTDAIQDGRTGILVAPRDPLALACALRLLIRDGHLRRRLGSAGRDFVAKHFDRDQVFSNLLTEYTQQLQAYKEKPAFGQPRRIADASLAAILAVITLPLLLAGMAAVALSMGSPIFFAQRRTGLHGRPFSLYKLRTMTNAGSQSHVTSVGRWLRALSVDELPQLWNVLRGHMSIVGPRPLLEEYLSRYTPLQALRHNVKPGITGLAQVSGRNDLSWERKFTLDIWYVQNRTWRLDLTILLRTLVRVLSVRGTAPTQQEAVPSFTPLADNLPAHPQAR